jgi:hypothetical protein
MRFNQEAHSDTGMLTPIAESVRATHAAGREAALPTATEPATADAGPN